MILEILDESDLNSYKDLMDECFDGSNSIEYYKKNYNKNSPYIIIVAKENNSIVGSITFYKIDLFTFSFQPALEIFNVGVLKEYRGKKIAKKLFEYVINYAKANNYKSIYLNCLDDAYDAHHLYDSIGFKRKNSRKYSLEVK